MLPLIPQPRDFRAGSGSYTVRSGSTVAAPAPLLRVATVFVDDLAVDGGPRLEVAESPVAGAIRLELSDDGLTTLPSSAGVRADGLDDADERYGLEVGADGIRVWGPTEEAVHRDYFVLT